MTSVTGAREVQVFGKSLFGRPIRLALGIHLCRRDSPTYLTELTTEMPDFVTSAIASELRLFADLGLLQIVRLDGSRRVYYQRIPSPWWKVFDAALDAVVVAQRDLKVHATEPPPTGGGSVLA